MPELRVQLTIIALLAAMILAGVLARRQWSGVAILTLLSFVWLTVDSRFEGGILFGIGDHHGLTYADFVALVGLAVAGVLGWRLRRRSG